MMYYLLNTITGQWALRTTSFATLPRGIRVIPHLPLLPTIMWLVLFFQHTQQCLLSEKNSSQEDGHQIQFFHPSIFSLFFQLSLPIKKWSPLKRNRQNIW